jgi:hypothetical protein
MILDQEGRERERKRERERERENENDAGKCHQSALLSCHI